MLTIVQSQSYVGGRTAKLDHETLAISWLGDHGACPQIAFATTTTRPVRGHGGSHAALSALMLATPLVHGHDAEMGHCIRISEDQERLVNARFRRLPTKLTFIWAASGTSSGIVVNLSLKPSEAMVRSDHLERPRE
ncbi:hypothetical protein SMMN14_02159 [Sphaerulina musiva]